MTTETLLYFFAIGFFVMTMALLIMHDAKDDELAKSERRADYLAASNRELSDQLANEKAKNNRAELIKGFMRSYPEKLDEPENNVIGFEASMRG